MSRLHTDDSPTMAFARADQAVYYAKANGRNAVCSHEDLVLRGLLDGAAKQGAVELF